eukprot:scaffold824_cov64-Phaeocystis_antarctica.AAC.8
MVGAAARTRPWEHRSTAMPLEEPAQQAAIVDGLLGLHVDELHVAAEPLAHVARDLADAVDHAHLVRVRVRIRVSGQGSESVVRVRARVRVRVKVEQAHLDARGARVDGPVEEASALGLQLAQGAAARLGERRGQPTPHGARRDARAVVQPCGGLGLEAVAAALLDRANEVGVQLAQQAPLPREVLIRHLQVGVHARLGLARRVYPALDPLLLERAHVAEAARDDADGADERVGVAHDLVRSARDVVPARGRAVLRCVCICAVLRAHEQPFRR